MYLGGIKVELDKIIIHKQNIKGWGKHIKKRMLVHETLREATHTSVEEN